MTITERIAQLDDATKSDLLANLRSAVRSLADCWDALREAENILCENGDDFEIETDAIESIAGDLDIPPTTGHLTLADFIEALEVENV